MEFISVLYKQIFITDIQNNITIDACYKNFNKNFSENLCHIIGIKCCFSVSLQFTDTVPHRAGKESALTDGRTDGMGWVCKNKVV